MIRALLCHSNCQTPEKFIEFLLEEVKFDKI